MGAHLEVQDEQEVMQLRSRELQLENTEKLENIIPIVETINNVDLNQIETSTSEIKEMVSTNLEDQPNIEILLDEIKKANKNISIMKGQITKLSKEIKELSKEDK